MRLLQSNFDEFTRLIPLDRLSWTYRTAVQMSLGLGYRYLWIDSLCITQDLLEDWTREAGKMEDVYSNGLCNISPLFPPESAGTSMISRKAESPCVLRVADAATSGVIIQPVTRSERMRIDGKGEPISKSA